MKFYEGTNLLNLNCIYNFIIGGRASGKSYWMAKHLIRRYLDHGEKFVRIIRNLAYANGLNNYFSIVEDDMREAGELPDDYKGIRMKHMSYYLGDEEIGRVLSISMEQKYKSLVFDKDYVNMMFEEFSAGDVMDYWMSPAYEIACFQSIISTVFRHRTGKVFFIGNNYEVNNPYFQHYGVEAHKLVLGQVTTFQPEIALGDKTVKGASVAVDYVPMAYENIDEIPPMLLTADNEMATTGEVTCSKYVIPNSIRYISYDGKIEAILLEGLSFIEPRILRTRWDNGKSVREYLFVVDIDGKVLVNQIGKEEDIVDMSDKSPAFIEKLCNTEGIYPMQNSYMEIPMDIETETGFKLSVMYFSDQITEYNFKEDCNDWRELHRLPEQLGMGTTPRTMVVKGYIKACEEGNLYGYGEHYTYSPADLMYKNHVNNNNLDDSFDIKGYLTNKVANNETYVEEPLNNTKECLMKQELLRKYAVKKATKQQEAKLQEQLEANPEDLLDRIQRAIVERTVENIYTECLIYEGDKNAEDVIRSFTKKAYNVVQHQITVNNVKDYWHIIPNPYYRINIPDLEACIDKCERKLTELAQRRKAKTSDVRELIPAKLPDGYSHNTSDYPLPKIKYVPRELPSSIRAYLNMND